MLIIIRHKMAWRKNNRTRKNEAKAFVSSLEKLSDGLKIKYSEKINDLTISDQSKKLKIEQVHITK
ncbi:hypothetical protein [Mycoplasmopsis cynos]|uniref:hypothetical protein n=1 Tax=Mycoplasmopsis cynos TaxID=171284 RepID=UPI0021FB0063|nr:hypothetical protein [Mycoplasmopsis cynos]UWV82664.1 hypothetical protein NW067_07095 [Mycoplasmopsis cynos]